MQVSTACRSFCTAAGASPSWSPKGPEALRKWPADPGLECLHAQHCLSQGLLPEGTLMAMAPLSDW